MRDVDRDLDRTESVDRAENVDRTDDFGRTDDVAAQPLPDGRDPLAEPLPVDEAGLERGRPEHDGAGMTTQMDAHPVDATPVDAQPVDATPMDAAPMPGTTSQAHDSELFAGDFAERLRARWRELQADFVDDPERAVREADDVVDEVMKTLTEHRQRLAGEWEGQTDTEHLRLALQGYRSFFDRLLPS